MLEIDFVCNKGAQRVYVQSAFQLSSTEKEQQEKRPLIKVDDSFRKFIVIKDDITRRQDANGVITISLKQLLTDKDCLE